MNITSIGLSRAILISLISLMFCVVLVTDLHGQSIRDYLPSQGLVRDVEIDDQGNIYAITLHWTRRLTHLKTYNPDGEERERFKMVLPDFCCDPFPLEMRFAEDGHLYTLLPGKKQTVLGIDFQIVKMTPDGKSVRDFGINGSLSFPPGFGLHDFDVAPDGTIWAMNESLEIYKFENDLLRKVLEMEKVFPQHIHGDRFREFVPLRLFALDDNHLLVFGRIRIDGDRLSPMHYFAAWEFDATGKLINRTEWESPWYSKRHGDDGSFFRHVNSLVFTQTDTKHGSVLGFEEGFRDEPDTRRLAIIDWSIIDGFHFYNVVPLELPKEVYLDYNLEQVRFARNLDRTILAFPFERNHNLLIVEYDADGKITNKFSVEAFR